MQSDYLRLIPIVSGKMLWLTGTAEVRFLDENRGI